VTDGVLSRVPQGRGEFPQLSGGFLLGGLSLRNRVVWRPGLTRFADQDGLPTRQFLDYYAERAREQVGLIVVESAAAHPASAWPRRLAAFDPRAVPGYAALTRAVHDAGACIVGQLADDGNQQDGAGGLTWHPTRGASAVADPRVGAIPRELSDSELHEIAGSFGAAAALQRQGGFDGVEIDAGVASLQGQFLSPVFNTREDCFGDSAQNRLRLLRETVEAVRTACGEDYPVGVRFELAALAAGGYSAESLTEYARMIKDWGLVDYLACGPDAIPEGELPGRAREAARRSWETCAEVRRATGLPLIAGGEVDSPARAEQLLRECSADLVGLGRPLISDSQWVSKVLEGRESDIRGCIRCDQGCVDRSLQGLPITCIVNPSAGREGRWGVGTLHASGSALRVLVVGAGPAGLKTAEIAARRGHRVTIAEKSTRVGGRVADLSQVASRAQFEEAVDWIEREIELLAVEVRLGAVLSLEDFTLAGAALSVRLADTWESFDRVIVATGATPVLAPVAGDMRVFSIPQVFENVALLGDHVLLWDTQLDQSSASTAEYIADSGRSVTIVTPADHAAGKVGVSSFRRQLERLARSNVTTVPHHNVVGSDEDGVTIEHAYTGERRTLPGYWSLVAACGWQADESLYLALRSMSENVQRVGDCVAPRDIGMAIHSAEKVARALGEESPAEDDWSISW